MNDFWKDLHPAWQICLDESWQAFCVGTILAHAELNALLALGIDYGNRHGWTLYTAVEPCPICPGAWYMSGLRGLAYAGKDPWAGSVNLLGTTLYLSRKPMRITHPAHSALEFAIVALQITHFDRSGGERHESGFYAAYENEMPRLVAFANQISTSGELIRMASTTAPAQQVFNTLARVWAQFIQPGSA